MVFVKKKLKQLCTKILNKRTETWDKSEENPSIKKGWQMWTLKVWLVMDVGLKFLK